nr:hypothetical protein [Streptomyces olivaceus]
MEGAGGGPGGDHGGPGGLAGTGHHAGLRVAGFYPSLHLNLADNYRRLGSFDAATAHLHAAEEHVPDLPQDAYGALLRTALDEVAQAVSRRDTTKRPRRTPE